MAHVWNKSTLAAGGAYEQKLYKKKGSGVRYFKVMDLADGKTATYVKYETASEPVDELLKAVKTFKRNTMQSTGEPASIWRCFAQGWTPRRWNAKSRPWNAKSRHWNGMRLFGSWKKRRSMGLAPNRMRY